MRSWIAPFFLLPVAALLNCPQLHAQAETPDTTAFLRNALHLEFWGASSVASLNYDRVLFKKRKLTALVRIGVGSIHLKDFTRRFNPDLIMPFGVYGFYGRRTMLELGAGGTFTGIVYPNETNFDPERQYRLHGWCSIGIRGNFDEHIWARFAFTPIFEFGRVTRTAALGVGYQF